MVARQGCGGPTVLAALEGAIARLARSVDEVNALNVYPVPDGDTGTNMLQTLRSAVVEARTAGDRADRVASAAAHGALMGARGNSGVILSQMLKGLADAFDGKAVVDLADVARAVELGHRAAHAAIARPAPGTMLSVASVARDSVGGASSSVTGLLRTAADAVGGALAATMADNPDNRAAGVVDAGAYGVWLIFAGALEALDASQPPLVTPTLRAAGATGAVIAAPASADVWTGGHCVQFRVLDPTRSVVELRAAMGELDADSVLVVGDERLIRVHIHTVQPQAALDVGAGAGRIDDAVVEDFDEMVAEHERASGIVVASTDDAALGCVAVVPGPGFARVARSLGAKTLSGGATMNPSVREIAGAIHRTRARRVIVLPNDKNVLLAAEAAAREVSVQVDVIPTRSAAAGMAAVVAFDAGRDPDEVVGGMRDAAARTRTIEVTRATRDATLDGVMVRVGEAIAFVDGALSAHGDAERDVMREAACSLGEIELLTLYVGAGVDEAAADAAAAALTAARPGAEVQRVDGGQRHYSFIVAAE